MILIVVKEFKEPLRLGNQTIPGPSEILRFLQKMGKALQCDFIY